MKREREKERGRKRKEKPSRSLPPSVPPSLAKLPPARHYERLKNSPSLTGTDTPRAEHSQAKAARQRPRQDRSPARRCHPPAPTPREEEECELRVHRRALLLADAGFATTHLAALVEMVNPRYLATLSIPRGSTGLMRQFSILLQEVRNTGSFHPVPVSESLFGVRNQQKSFTKLPKLYSLFAEYLVKISN